MNQIQYNERDVLEVLGKYKCDTGMSVEDVPVSGVTPAIEKH